MSCATRGCREPTGSQCHCAACHQTFGTLGSFDAHQTIDRNGALAGPCKEPERLGLLLDGKGTWQTREGLISRAELATRAREMRKAR